jgi:PAS domain S-box-containing protein
LEHYPVWSGLARRGRKPAQGRDISERHQAEQARALLASIVESSDDAIKAVGLDGTIANWNRGAELLYGYATNEIIGKNVAILVPPDRRHELDHWMEAIRKGCTVSPFDTIRQTKDGRKIDVDVPIRNSAGELVGASAIAHDIGKRVRVERKLRESEERFREVFENAPFGTCVTSLDGRFVQVNAAYCRSGNTARSP